MSYDEDDGHGKHGPRDDLIEAARTAANRLAEALASGRMPVDSLPGYSMVHELHRGGQGVVYRTLQLSTGRDVAIKFMLPSPSTDPRDLSRFDREVRVLAQLKHPNIVTIHDRGMAGGMHYFVMDYVEGRALDEFARGRPIREKLHLFVKVCDAVAAAHLRGIIHRDLKPSNVIVDGRGEPYVLDFGLAKLSAESDDRTRTMNMTCTGQFVGSLPWASPEQADSPDQVDLRTDVYSLGVILYQLLTGQFPYPVTGKMREVLRHIADVEPTPPRSINPGIDGDLQTVVLKCLAKESDRRYQSAGELARDVRHYLAGEPIEARRESTLYMLRKKLRRYRAALAVGSAFVLVLTISSVVGWSLYARSQRNLWSSYLAQARATRATGRAGQRFDTLDTLAKAAAIKPTIELRNEAIAGTRLPPFAVGHGVTGLKRSGVT